VSACPLLLDALIRSEGSRCVDRPASSPRRRPLGWSSWWWFSRKMSLHDNISSRRCTSWSP